jgi:hypothetical protein
MDALELIGKGFWNAFQMAWESVVGARPWRPSLGRRASVDTTRADGACAWRPRLSHAAALDGPGRGVVVLQLRGGGDRQVDVPKGRELRGSHGLPVRLDEPRLRDRNRPLDLPRLAVRRRPSSSAASSSSSSCGSASAISFRGGSRSKPANTRSLPRPATSITLLAPRALARAADVRFRFGRMSLTTYAAIRRCSGRRSSAASSSPASSPFFLTGSSTPSCLRMHRVPNARRGPPSCCELDRDRPRGLHGPDDAVARVGEAASWERVGLGRDCAGGRSEHALRVSLGRLARGSPRECPIRLVVGRPRSGSRHRSRRRAPRARELARRRLLRRLLKRRSV